MNIFYLDSDPQICATYHADKHVVKMILETAQLLSTTHRFLDGEMVIERDKANRRLKRWKFNDERDEIFYKSTHVNHPSAIWVRQSKANYEWLYKLFIELLNEYTYRRNKTHKSSELAAVLATPPQNIPIADFTQPTAAMDNEYIISTDNIVNYRNYYIQAKSHLLDYTKREKPEWITI